MTSKVSGPLLCLRAGHGVHDPFRCRGDVGHVIGWQRDGYGRRLVAVMQANLELGDFEKAL
ncbi:hypothetical protein ACPZ19_18700 [Amycolatopsis lurida]